MLVVDEEESLWADRDSPSPPPPSPPHFTASPPSINNNPTLRGPADIMQSGISGMSIPFCIHIVPVPPFITNRYIVSQELQDAFTTFNADTSSFCLPVTITAESLTPLKPIAFNGTPSSPDSFFSSLSQISSVLEPKTPIYLLLRRPTSAATTLIALTYIPSNAPVRPKMLFASTRSTLTRELGTEKFGSTVFATEEEEIVSADAWRERDGENSPARREELMGEKERELEAVRRAEAEARNGTPQRDIGIGGTFGPGSGSGMRVSMPVDEAAKAALNGLQDGSLVQLVCFAHPILVRLYTYYVECDWKRKWGIIARYLERTNR